jgi:PhzF family phenazine biosynthesis protein
MSAEVLRYAAFTDAGRGGNPAGVVLDAEGLDAAEMLAIAADVGYSETAFVRAEAAVPGRYQVRYFSPLAEVAFCGHATVATGVALAKRDGPGRLALETPAGPLTVVTEATSDGITATLTSPPASTRPATEEQLARTLRAFGWAADDLDPRFPVHVANAGNDHLVIAAATPGRLAVLEYDYDALARLMAEEGWTTVHAFCARSAELFEARDPFPPGGVVEDPATGAAAAAFGGYLRWLEPESVPRHLTILQGHHIGRPSRLLVRLDGDVDTVRVTGFAAPMEPA